MREAGDTPCKRHRRAKAPFEQANGKTTERPVGQNAAHIVEEGVVLLKTRVTAAAAADPTE